jgi:DNA-binding MarR family transcriptional regulator
MFQVATIIQAAEKRCVGYRTDEQGDLQLYPPRPVLLVGGLMGRGGLSRHIQGASSTGVAASQASCCRALFASDMSFNNLRAWKLPPSFARSTRKPQVAAPFRRRGALVETSKASDVEQIRLILGLLTYIERGGEQSQRRLASELGVALGLANAYLRRCIKKGLVKVGRAPARRYAYYLTPRGFTEKSRLTFEFMSHSFTLFRQAKTDCTVALQAARERGYTRIALLGASDLAEVAAICALDGGLVVTAVVDPTLTSRRFAGAPVVSDLDLMVPPPDGVLVTDMRCSNTTLQTVIAKFGAERVLVPALLGVRTGDLRRGL